MKLIDDVLIDIALTEDLGSPWRDVTCEYLLADLPSRDEIVAANIISKHDTPIVLCGLELITALANKLDKQCQIQTSYQDGDLIQSGNILFTVQGTRAAILMLERTLLNFLRHMCAVATLTRQFVDKIKSSPTKILDTRKTTPGFRRLDKYAVKCGGGVNHRMGLYDAVMIKDTHVDLLGGMEKTLQKLPDEIDVPVIVEVRSVEELEIALQFNNKIDRILLDNMNTSQVQKAVQRCKGLLETEASGNITLSTIEAIAATGVDFASVGLITHSAGNVDLSMKVI